jgi:predicted alpha/beta hydrolase
MPDHKPRKCTFESRDGFILRGEWHASDSLHQKQQQVAIISPGMGIPARFYRAFARHLSRRGIDVLLFDFRGIGWSAVSDLSELEADATIWGSFDLAAAIDHALSLAKGKQALGIGHSFGGSIFGFADNMTKLHKLVHICSQSGYYRFYDWRTRLYMLFNIRLAMPLLTRMLGYYPAHWLSNSEALPAGFVAEWSSWCLEEEYFMADRFRVSTAGYHGQFEGPLLSLSFADDAYATQQSVDAMAAFHINSQLLRKHLRPADYTAEFLGHFGVFKASNGRKIWDLIANWLSEPIDSKRTLTSESEVVREPP